MEQSDFSGNSASQKVNSLVGQKFSLIANVNPGNDEFAVLQVLMYSSRNPILFWRQDSSLIKKYNYPTSKSDLLVFRVSEELVQDHATKYERYGTSLAFGVINFPFKYRPQKGVNDFEGGFNLGAAIGIKLPHYSYKKFSWSLLSAYSISNVALDSTSVKRNGNDLLLTNNYSAFTFSLGGMAEYEKVQAGVFIGWDILGRINQDHYGWDYSGKTWLSVGFGYSIFSSDKANPTAKSGN
ncbi:MAG: hypothetical protein RJQ14_22970, partial [Marinoscillum sp.]